MKNNNKTFNKSSRNNLKTNRSLKIISYIILFLLASIVILFLAVSLSPKTYGDDTEIKETLVKPTNNKSIAIEPEVICAPVEEEIATVEFKPAIEEVISTEPDTSESVKEESVNAIDDLKSAEPIKRETIIEQEVIEGYVDEICDIYTNVDRLIVRGMIWRESSFNPNAINKAGTCVGLMQLMTKYHIDRAKSLGVSDLMDPYGNILVGVDLLSELIDKYEDISYALMCYHGGENYGKKKWNAGVIDSYTKDILKYAESLREGG